MVAQNPFLQSALAYAAAGFRVFPCLAGHKEPAWKWVEEATQDPDRLRSWWRDLPDANLAAVAGDQWLILDIDNKPGKPNGYDTLKDILPRLPPTFTVATPNQGEHRYYSKPSDWQPARRRGQGYDIQTGNAYVLVPPSRVSVGFLLGEYRVLDGSPIAALPEVLKVFLESGGGAPRVSEPDAGVPPELDRTELDAIWPDVSGWPERIRLWWDNGDASGYDSRSEAVNGLAWYLYQQSLTDEQVLAVMGEHYWTAQVAREHRSRDPRGWLWLSCLKTRGDRKPSADEVFEAQAGESVEALYERLYARVQAMSEPNTPGTLRELAGVLAEGRQLSEVAKALLATLVGDKNLGMTRKQAEAVLSPPKSRKGPKGSGQSNPALAELKDFVWVGSMERFYNVRTGLMLTKASLINQYAHLASEQQSPEEVVAEVLRQESVKFEGLTFRPELEAGPVQEPEGLKWNVYQGLALTPLEGDWGPYLALFKYMQIANEDRDHLLDYMAHLLQRPGKRIRHALVIGGKGHGTGKDTLLEPLKRALGERHVHELKGRNLYARFNGYMLRSRVVLVQEAHQENVAHARMLEQQLKPLITADWVEIEQKGIDPFMARNYVHWFITTNEPHPLHITAGDRRYAMIRVGLVYTSEEHRLSWDEYWTGFYRWLDGGGAQYVLWHLLQRDISGFNPDAAPRHTLWHQEVVQMSLTEEEALVEEAIDQPVGVLGWEFFTLDHAWASVKAFHPHQLDKNGRPISRWAVQQALKKFGYTDHRLRFRLKGTLQQFRVWTNRADVIKSRNPEAHWRVYQSKVKQVPELQGGGIAFLPVDQDESSEDPDES